MVMPMPLPTGKVDPHKLAKLVFPHIKLNDPRVLVGPKLGVDAAVVSFGEKVLVLSSDPITGALHDPGWLAVHINANDVATMGAKPSWFLADLFAPENCGEGLIQKLVKRMSAACEEIGVSLVGGHTEVTPGLDRVIISGAMIGEAEKDKFVTSAGAKPGDKIIMTKSAAIEGTAILAFDREKELENALGRDPVNRAKKFMRKISVVKDALVAINAGGVTAMHDPTEGGIVGGLFEMAEASGVGFSVSSSAIKVERETEMICDYFDMDPLRTISSGCLLIAADPKMAERVVSALSSNDIPAKEIGVITPDPKERLIDGKRLSFPKQDHLWRVFKS
jgi:hydrogenase maturation factor